jgi:hypothetical protein
MNQTGAMGEKVRNTRWMRGVPGMTGKILTHVLVLGVLSLMLAALLMVKSAVLRIPLNLLLFCGVGFLLHLDAAHRGQKEVARAKMLAGRMRAGYVPDDHELSGCYHPMRGVAAALLAAAPFLLAAAALALLSRPFTYALQDLPSWLAGYQLNADVSAPLAYYAQNVGASAVDYLRPAVRLAIMPAAYLFGGFGSTASLWLDRLSPLLVLVLPGAYALGYLRGPAMDERMIVLNKEAKRLHQKKIARKKRRDQQRALGKKKPERII